uniref:metallophosphoesterase family protein n=1 Tax=Angelakisella sp. TaxID=1935177 RepID=UPI003FEEDA74
PPLNFFKLKTAYEIGVRLVCSEMCLRDRYGHTHLAKIEYREERYFLNPGSLRQPMEGHPSYIELNLDDKNVVPILVEL